MLGRARYTMEVVIIAYRVESYSERPCDCTWSSLNVQHCIQPGQLPKYHQLRYLIQKLFQGPVILSYNRIYAM